MTPPILGCIADDITDATCMASMLVQNGMRTVQTIGVPQAQPEADAVVVALTSRTLPVQQAVGESLAALAWLQRAGCRQFLFTYGSAFDSTEEGNIGPVGDALMDALGCGFALACPAFPANGRTVYLGHLFFGAALLHESGPTPVRDANLVRVLGRQTRAPVGLVPFAVVEQGAAAIRRAMTALKEQGRRWAIVDALTETHLRAIGEAAAPHALITGGAGVAIGLPENFRRSGLLPARADAGVLPDMRGPGAVIAGACARATLAQIGRARAYLPVLELDPLATPDAAALTQQATQWAAAHVGELPVVIAASAPPERVAALQAQLGRDAADALLEQALAGIAEALLRLGVRRLIAAGSDTAAAVARRLQLRSLRVGAAIDPGVPWTYAEGGGAPLLLALKSGTSGAPDCFLKAFAMLEGDESA